MAAKKDNATGKTTGKQNAEVKAAAILAADNGEGATDLTDPANVTEVLHGEHAANEVKAEGPVVSDGSTVVEDAVVDTDDEMKRVGKAQKAEKAKGDLTLKDARARAEQDAKLQRAGVALPAETSDVQEGESQKDANERERLANAETHERQRKQMLGLNAS